MATSIGQYAPVSLPGELPLPDREAWQATDYRVAKSQTLPKWPYAHRRKTLLPVAALPQWELSVKVAQLLGLQGLWQRQVCRDTDCLCLSSIRVFFWASCSWPSEGLFGQSFSIALLIQALRGLPCLGSFSVVQHVRHISAPSPPPPFAPQLGSYSVDPHVRHLKGHPGWGPTLLFGALGFWWASFSIVQLSIVVCGWRERLCFTL